jgi:hypothetical protein
LTRGVDVYDDVYVMKMVRKQFYITPEQDEELKRLAKARGQTEAEVVRGALDGLREVTYEARQRESGNRVAETAVLEYKVDEDVDIGARAREQLRRRLAREAWEKELAFLRSLGAGRSAGDDTRSAWKFNREELYEERLNKILRRQ